MLQVRNCKLILLAALLIGAAGSLAAEEYSKGLFSVGDGEYVQLATTNYTSGATEYFTWSEAKALAEAGTIKLLTQAQWNYLFQTRSNAYHLFALASVGGVNGLVILPDYDIWVWPNDELRAAWNHHDTQDGFDKNPFSTENWALMEAAGAVFIPCKGYWDGSAVVDESDHGSYWTLSEDPSNDTKGYRLQFDETYVCELQSQPKGNHYSLRAAKSVTVLSENDEQGVFETKKGTLESGTEAYIIRTLRKAGCFNTLTLPFNVPDIEHSPLADAEVYTFTSATVEAGTLLLDIAPVTSNSLSAGTPYLIQWDNTGEVMTYLHFTGITWDDDNNADQAGNGDVHFQGFYGKTHINDDTNGDQHLNLFLAGGNELYWPNDGADENAKMLGFRAFFNVTTGVSSSPIRRGMPAALRIVENSNTTTDVDHVQRDDAQCTKVMRDGQLYLLHNGRMYNVQGQMIKEGGLQ